VFFFLFFFFFFFFPPPFFLPPPTRRRTKSRNSIEYEFFLFFPFSFFFPFFLSFPVLPAHSRGDKEGDKEDREDPFFFFLSFSCASQGEEDRAITLSPFFPLLPPLGLVRGQGMNRFLLPPPLTLTDFFFFLYLGTRPPTARFKIFFFFLFLPLLVSFAHHRRS